MIVVSFVEEVDGRWIADARDSRTKKSVACYGLTEADALGNALIVLRGGKLPRAPRMGVKLTKAESQLLRLILEHWRNNVMGKWVPRGDEATAATNLFKLFKVRK